MTKSCCEASGKAFQRGKPTQSQETTMKTLTIILILCALPILAAAENPDSRPSISIGISGNKMTGDFSYRGIDQDRNGSIFSLNGGFKIPVSLDVTIWGGLGYSDGKHESEENFFYYRSGSNSVYVSFNAGITFYIGKSINK